MNNYKFETLQLHVGQEQADPATDARAKTDLPRRPLMYFMTALMLLRVLDWRIRATSTVV